MLKRIFIILAVVVVAFVVVAALQPAEYRVARSISISAPPSVVFAQVNDLHKFQTWSPFAKIDPAAKNVFEGPASGSGAVFVWSGNAEVGEGRMTIIESHPDDLIRFQLDFVKPFTSTATAEFTFKPEKNQTVATWTLAGRKNFVSKAISLFMSMDKMIGSQFEKGLADLKSLCESAPKP